MSLHIAVANSLYAMAHMCESANPSTYTRIGGDNTQSCGPERERLDTPAECMEAAGALDKSYGYTGSYAGWPLASPNFQAFPTLPCLVACNFVRVPSGRKSFCEKCV